MSEQFVDILNEGSKTNSGGFVDILKEGSVSAPSIKSPEEEVASTRKIPLWEMPDFEKLPSIFPEPAGTVEDVDVESGLRILGGLSPVTTPAKPETGYEERPPGIYQGSKYDFTSPYETIKKVEKAFASGFSGGVTNIFDKEGIEPVGYEHPLVGLANAAGLILGPGKVVKPITKAVTKKIPGLILKGSEGMLARTIKTMAAETPGMAAFGTAATIGKALEQDDWEDATDVLWEGTKGGALMGLTFAGTRGVFWRSQKDRIKRLAAGMALLDYQRGTQPFDERGFWEKVRDYTIDGFFLWGGLPDAFEGLEKEVSKRLKEQNLEDVLEKEIKKEEKKKEEDLKSNPYYGLSDRVVKKDAELNRPEAVQEWERRQKLREEEADEVPEFEPGEQVEKAPKGKVSRDGKYLGEARKLKRKLGKDNYYAILKSLGIEKANQVVSRKGKAKVLEALRKGLEKPEEKEVEVETAKETEEKAKEEEVKTEEKVDGDVIARDLNLDYNGVQENAKGEPVAYLFTDPKTGGTFSSASLDKNVVKKAMLESRKKFKVEEPEEQVESSEVREPKAVEEPTAEEVTAELPEKKKAAREKASKIAEEIRARRKAREAEKSFGEKSTIEEPIRTVPETPEDIDTTRRNIADQVQRFRKGEDLDIDEIEASAELLNASKSEKDFAEPWEYEQFKELNEIVLDLIRKVREEKGLIREEAEQKMRDRILEDTEDLLEAESLEDLKEVRRNKGYEEEAEDWERRLAEEGMPGELDFDEGVRLYDITGATIEGLNRVYEKALDAFKKAPSFENLKKISRGIMLEGKVKYVEFRRRMKEITGDLWETAKKFVKDAWNAAKEWNKKVGEEGKIRVLQGSGKMFERVRDKYVGSGEGAQVKGWGHYFTSKREVANWYAKEVGSGKSKYVYRGYPLEYTIMSEISGSSARSAIYDVLERQPKSLKALKSAIKTTLRNNAEKSRRLATEADKEYREIFIKRADEYAKALEEIERIDFDEMKREEKGKYVHEFELPFKESDFLDLDYPISKEHRDKLISAFSKSNIPDLRLDAVSLKEGEWKPTGTEIQNSLQRLLGSEKASKFLSEAGIPGSTYIGRDSGVRNYVIFGEEYVPPKVQTFTLDFLGMQQLFDAIADRLSSERAERKALTKRAIKRRRMKAPKATEIDINDIRGLGRIRDLDDKGTLKVVRNLFGYKKGFEDLTAEEADLVKLKLIQMEPKEVMENEKLVYENPDVKDSTKKALKRAVKVYDVDDVELGDYLDLCTKGDKLTNEDANLAISLIRAVNEIRPDQGRVIWAYLAPAKRLFGEKFIAPMRKAEVQRLDVLIPGNKKITDLFHGLNIDSREAISKFLEGDLSREDLSPQELAAADGMRELYKQWWEDFGIEGYIEQYSPNLPKFGNQEDLIDWAFSRRGLKDFDFWAEHRRTGDLDAKELDAKRLAQSYLRAGLAKKFYSDALEEVKPIISAMSPERASLAKKWIDTVIRKRPTADEIVANRFIKGLLKKAGMKVDENARYYRQLVSTVLDLNYSAYMGLRPKLAIRNLSQQFLIMNEYGYGNYLKGRIGKYRDDVKSALEKSDVYKLRKKQYLVVEDEINRMSDLPADLRQKMMWFYRKADLDNVEVAFATGYLAAKKTRPNLPESYAIRAGEKAIHNTQWGYGMDLPYLFKTPTGKFVGQYSSWPIWYADHIVRMFKEKHGAKMARTAAQAIIIGLLLENFDMDYTRTVLLGVAPDALGYGSQSVLNVAKLIKSLGTFDSGRIEQAGKRVGNDVILGLVPGYLAAKDIKKFMEGKPEELFLYMKKEKKSKGGKGLGTLGSMGRLGSI